MLKKLNYFVYRTKYTNAVNLPLKKPVDVSIELSGRCTNACDYCYYADRKRLPFKQGQMKKELAYKIINDASNLGVNSLKWNYRGEATMHPNFEELTAYAKSRAVGPTFIDRIVNSNFNFRNDRGDIFRGLLNLTKVKVSFDSFRKDIFEKQRVGSRYEDTLKNMHDFHDYPGRTTKFVIQAVRTKLNHDEDLEYEIKTRFPDATMSIRDVVAGRVDKDVSEYTFKDRDASERKSCIQAHARLIIHWNGKVVPCCPSITDALVVGDLNTETISEVWNGYRAKNLRKMLKDKSAFKLDPCKNCSSYETFKGYKVPWDS